jgi:hypothetical protein
MRAWAWGLVVLLAGGVARGQEDRFRPLVPPWLSPCVVYHSAFEDGSGQPDLEAAGLVTDVGYRQGGGDPAPEGVQSLEHGFTGQGLEVRDWRAPLVLRGEAVSPHHPLTLSFWWALPYDLAADGGYQLFSLNGAGMVALFCRGKGEWCALQRPAGVFQVYYFQGIQNINGIYDFDLLAHCDLRKGVWHHTAVVFRLASVVQVYTDGKLVTEATLSGREFSAADGLVSLSLGGPLWLDEVMVLNRAVDGGMVADYVRGARRAREYLEGE